jgi:hypothetical protein
MQTTYAVRVEDSKKKKGLILEAALLLLAIGARQVQRVEHYGEAPEH